jgi:hypothetical protein
MLQADGSKLSQCLFCRSVKEGRATTVMDTILCMFMRQQEVLMTPERLQATGQLLHQQHKSRRSRQCYNRTGSTRGEAGTVMTLWTTAIIIKSRGTTARYHTTHAHMPGFFTSHSCLALPPSSIYTHASLLMQSLNPSSTTFAASPKPHQPRCCCACAS